MPPVAHYKGENMKNFTLCLIAAIALCGCATPQDRYGGDVYDASETNRMRQSDRIEIVDVLPAKINVERSEGNTGKILGGVAGGTTGAIIGHKLGKHSSSRRLAETVGLIGGAAVGALAGDAIQNSQKTVQGSNIIYKLNGKEYSSVQADPPCRFKRGKALLIHTGSETRVQPNSGC